MADEFGVSIVSHAVMKCVSAYTWLLITTMKNVFISSPEETMRKPYWCVSVRIEEETVHNILCFTLLQYFVPHKLQYTSLPYIPIFHAK